MWSLVDYMIIVASIMLYEDIVEARKLKKFGVFK